MNLDWQAIFGLSLSPWELIVRGTAMYWFLFALFRLAIRRRVGAVGIGDVLLLVIIADAAQNAMSGDYRSTTDGVILVGTIVAWNVFTDWLTYRFATMQRLLEPPPLLLVRNGRVLHRNLRLEFVSEGELRAKLREHGVTNFRDVETAYMESDGAVSVVKRTKRATRQQ